ncbi:L,D-transpeptidase [Aureimonas populi]|uniref:L,D-transpeptidase n=1 Tax=Aureimonas populi TaxID=1701758 RepID=A0ABW5CGJ7_9HYPH|nr:L,D-transpeptidase [Aureimonas populi]
MSKTLNHGGLSRRHLLLGLGAGAALSLTGCMSAGGRAPITAYAPQRPPVRPAVSPEYAAAYGPISDGGFNIPGIDFSRVDPQYLRREVDYFGAETPGTIIIDTPTRFAYLVRPGNRAIRYGVGIGRDGFEWDGRARVQYKRQWPTWTPPREMIARQPELERFADGQAPGLDNPLGARALYLFQNGEDTLYRLHGTPEYWTIGRAVSSGCVRFMNHDIIDLYDRAEDGATVIVNQGPATV